MADARRSRFAAALAALAVLPSLALTGCRGGTLESGYAYRPLDSTTVERRGFYADAYSLDARRAESERKSTGGSAGPARPAVSRSGRGR